MKYYSDKLDALYGSVEELEQAEQKAVEEEKRKQALKDERSKRAKEVEDAIEKANQLMQDFIKDYGAFHASIKHDTGWLNMLLSLFDF